MNELIKGLLAYSRVSTHGLPFQPTDCQVLVEQAWPRSGWRSKKAAPSSPATRCPLSWLTRSQIAQLFQNLISNAIKFRGSQPAADSHPRRAARRRLEVFGSGQRHRHRPAIRRPRLHHFPKAACARRISRCRDRPGHLQAHRPAPRRPHLGGIRIGQRRDLLLNATGGEIKDALEARRQNAAITQTRSFSRQPTPSRKRTRYLPPSPAGEKLYADIWQRFVAGRP